MNIIKHTGKQKLKKDEDDERTTTRTAPEHLVSGVLLLSLVKKQVCPMLL